MVRRLAILALWTTGIQTARGDEPAKPTAPVAPATAFAMPKDKEAADAVIAAVKAGGAELPRLAALNQPDPWRVVDELLSRGESKTAVAFAQAAPRPDTEALPAYIAAWKAGPDDVARRARRAAAGEAYDAKRFAESLDALGPATAFGAGDVVAVRMASTRAFALAGLARWAEAESAALTCVAEAERLGWITYAAGGLWIAANSARQRGDFEAAVAASDRLCVIQDRRRDAPAAAYARLELGIALRQKGDLARAQAIDERAFAEFEALGDKARAAAVLGNLGLVHSDGGDYVKARSCHERALVMKDAIGDKDGAAATLTNLGALHRARGDFAQAAGSLERALALREALGAKAGIAEALILVAGVERDRGNFAVARASCERALAISQELKDVAGESDAWMGLGSVLRLSGAVPASIEASQRAIEMLERLGRKGKAARARANLGRAHADSGDFVLALTTLEAALEEFTKLNDASAIANAWTSIGRVHIELADYGKAREALERALVMQQERGARVSAAGTLELLASVSAHQGDYAKALGLAERVLAEYRAVGSRAGAAGSLAVVAGCHEKLGDYARALSALEEVLAEQEAIGASRDVARTLGNLGDLQWYLGNKARADEFHRRSLAATEAIGDRIGTANALFDLARSEASDGDPAEAIRMYERALLIYEGTGDRSRVAIAKSSIASVQLDRGDSKTAIATFEAVLALRESIGERALVAKTLSSLGHALMYAGRRPEARVALEKSVRGAKSLRATPTLVFALRLLARLHLDEGDGARALSRAREALTEVEKLLGGLGDEEGADARGEHARLFEVGAMAALVENDAAEALSFLESGRAGALLDSLGKREQLRWKAETLPEDLRVAEAAAIVAERRARLEFDAVAQSTDDRAKLAAASKALDEASDGLRGVSARIQRETKRAAGLFYPRATTLDEAQAALAPGEALVLYGLCLDQAIALVVRADGTSFAKLGSKADVLAACEGLEASDRSSDPTAAIARLRRLLVAPLRLSPAVSRVIVSPDGLLGYVPFGALFDLPVAVTPSATTHALLRDEERLRGEGVLALGDPDYAGLTDGAKAVYGRRGVLARLPGTRDEANRVGTVVLLGADASEDGLRTALAKRPRWRSVHFACHGLVDAKRPTLSSLALSRAGEGDGFLTALEVGRMQIPSDIVVLSACETGRGRLVGGEGIVGLTRSFMYAGSPRVLCSLWKVDDEATAALMTKFYELWNPRPGPAGAGTPSEPGEPKGPRGLPAATALREAQAFIRSQPKWSHPYYWAAWVLWGLPS